MKKWKYKRCDI